MDARSGTIGVRVIKLGDEIHQHRTKLAFVASHQHRVLERVLAQLANLFEVLAQHFQLFHAGDDMAVRRASDGLG